MYWPYDEVTLKQGDAPNKISVTCPWLTATVTVPEDDCDAVQILVEKSARDSLAIEDLTLVQWLFVRLSQYPLAYVLPTPKQGQDHHELQDRDIVAAGLKQILKKAVEAPRSQSDVTAFDIEEIVAALPRTDLNWDVDSALAFSRTQKGIHPESLFSVARRYHLIDVLESNQASKNFDEIESLDPEHFALASAMMVRQNHYVTERCQEALTPALRIAQSATDAVQEFIQEENGHDKILGVALKSVGSDYANLPASLHTRMLMQLLQFAASRNFLAFAIAVDFFERSTNQDSDPMAQLLQKGGFDKAARHIDRHKDINDAGGHENIAFGFLSNMDYCDEAYAIEALKIAEAVNLVMNHVSQSAMDLFLAR